ncbi:hypothetical protein NMK71_04850 [Weeksellaceae bacterium KMM 9713]|uniref:Uncharacterized protein n=1 Tax=Profundicola chukchiensis TaxID=2961959 RepID=A0A9X4RX67_9FLAO|nr:hypothetical protein [Profundicola chukchiensis]MDG4945734.1 hypothetical protein [Profundicola chukchiensis]
MSVILIIVAIIALVLIFRAINSKGQKQNNNELSSLLEKMHKEIFPNGEKDIEEGTQELLRILNHKVDKNTAKNIFIKSSSICYTTTMSSGFSKERLKQHLAPYALDYFNEYALNEFYDYIVSKNERASIIEISRKLSQVSNPNGADQDMMPEGYGEFGLEITNPIPASSIPDSYFYLNRLKTENGSEITYKRVGGMIAPNISHTVDAYSISANGQELAIIYICPYNKKTSTLAPHGFTLS